MHFPTELISGTLTSRYKRFFAEVTLDSGEDILAHCPNTGPMLGVLNMPQRAWVAHNTNPKRKLQYTLEIAENSGVLIGCNTLRTNHIAKELFENANLTPFGEASIKSEVKISPKSRIDFVLNTESTPIYVEVKNVSFVENNAALFPDTVSLRAQKHIGELMHLRVQGKRAALVYIVQRNDITGFRPGGGLDPQYATLCAEAVAMGVEFYAFSCTVTPQEITATSVLPIIL